MIQGKLKLQKKKSSETTNSGVFLFFIIFSQLYFLATSPAPYSNPKFPCHLGFSLRPNYFSFIDSVLGQSNDRGRRDYFWLKNKMQDFRKLLIALKGTKGQNKYLTRVFNRKIHVTLRQCILYPDKVSFEISPLKVVIRFAAGTTSG